MLKVGDIIKQINVDHGEKESPVIYKIESKIDNVFYTNVVLGNRLIIIDNNHKDNI